LGEGLTTPHREDVNVAERRRKTRTTTEATKNGDEMWHVEHEDPV
jgi:hypothetical protein